MTDDRVFDIVAVLEAYGWELPHLSGNGWLKVRCHEHDDRHASAAVNLQLGAVKCFTCSFHGDAISVIRQKEGCSYREAVTRAEALTEGSDRMVRDASGRRGSVPGRKGNPPVRRRYVPSWRRHDPA